MATNVYEGLFILDSNRYSRDASGVSGQIGEIVQKHGGEMLASRLWEERRLAYPINGNRKGTYWLVYFKLDSSRITAIEGDFRLSDSIMRQLILKVDPRIADALVSHAVSGTAATPNVRKPEGEGEAVEASADEPSDEGADEEAANEVS